MISVANLNRIFARIFNIFVPEFFCESLNSIPDGILSIFFNSCLYREKTIPDTPVDYVKVYTGKYNYDFTIIFTLFTLFIFLNLYCF